MSRSQKRIDVEKFSSKRMWWTYTDGKLVAEKDISRDPFGTFEIRFRQCLENGNVEMGIENRDYPSLNRAAVGYESFPAAVEAIAEYFEGIDEKAKKVSQNVKERARQASRYIIAQEIERISREGV